MRVDLGSGMSRPEGFLTSDKEPLFGCDITFDLEQPRWPFDDESVDEYRAVNSLEHCADTIHVMNEIWRTLKVGGTIMLAVPSTNGVGAFCDPTHKSFWNLATLYYFTKPSFYIQYPQIKARFDVIEAFEIMAFQPDVGHIPYVNARLCKRASNGG